MHYKFTGRKVMIGSETNTKANDMDELSYKTFVTFFLISFQVSLGFRITSMLGKIHQELTSLSAPLYHSLPLRLRQTQWFSKL